MSDGLTVFLFVSAIIQFVVFIAFLNLCNRVHLLLDRVVSLDAHAVQQNRYLEAMAVNVSKFAANQRADTPKK